MLRVVEDCGGLTCFNDPTFVHHHAAIGDLPHNSEVV